MTIDTKGIIIRSTKYGETSLICNVFTEDLGLQSYIFKGVRTTKASNRKANILFPGAILDMIVYHYPNKAVNYVKEYNINHQFGLLDITIIKNCILTFAIEVMNNMIINDEEHKDIFHFYEKFIEILTKIDDNQCANLPLYFIIQMSKLCGYSIAGKYSNYSPYLDIQSGSFTSRLNHQSILNDEETMHLYTLIQMNDAFDFITYTLSNNQRHHILQQYIDFLQYHISYFKELKCLSILQVILR